MGEGNINQFAKPLYSLLFGTPSWAHCSPPARSSSPAGDLDKRFPFISFSLCTWDQLAQQLFLVSADPAS